MDTASAPPPSSSSLAIGAATEAFSKNNFASSTDQMTSKDYYFDSYAHFGIHEVCFIIHYYWYIFGKSF